MFALPDPVPSDSFDAFELLVRRRRSSLLCDVAREVPRPMIERLCAMVFAAPNHKRTVPWQVAVCTAGARAQLGEALAADLVEAAREVTEAKVTKTRTKYQRAPVVVAVGCRPDADEGRHREDTFAVAAGMQNLLLGATAAGLATLWSSPPIAVSPRVNALAGFAEGTELLGLIYVGWPTGESADAPAREGAISWL